MHQLLNFLISHREQLDVLEKILTITGLLFAVPLFFYNKLVTERKRSAIETYRNLNDAYQDTLKFMAKNLDLDPFGDLPPETAAKLTVEQERRLKITYSVLVALFERAHIFTKEEGKWMEARISEAWDGYMRDWAQRPKFRHYLPEILSNDDPEFSRKFREMAELPLKG